MESAERRARGAALLCSLLPLAAPAAGLVAHYSFDDPAASSLFADSAGGGLHCTRLGVPRGPGRSGYGADAYPSSYSDLLPARDTNGSLVRCPPWRDYWARAAGARGATVGLWVHRRVEGAEGYDEEVLVDAPGGLRLSMLPAAGGRTVLRLAGAGRRASCSAELAAKGPHAAAERQLLPSRWHHILAGAGGSPPQAAIWVDGRQVASCSGVALGDGSSSAAPVTLLGAQNEPDRGLRGAADDVRIWSGLRSASTAAAALAAAAPVPLPADHLAAQWTFDAHSQASSVYDVSGAGRHLTLSRGTATLYGPPLALRGASAALSGRAGWSAGYASRLRWSPGGQATLMGWWRPRDPYGVSITGPETTETTLLAAAGQQNASSFEARIGVRHFGAAQGMQSGAFAESFGYRCGPTSRREGRAYSSASSGGSSAGGQWWHIAGTFYAKGNAVYLQGVQRRRCVWPDLDAPELYLSSADFAVGSTNLAGALDAAGPAYLLDDLRVYGIALDPASIARAAQELQPAPAPPLPAPGLLARIDCDGIVRSGSASFAATVFRDRSARGLDAVPNPSDSTRPQRVVGVHGGAVAFGDSDGGPLHLPPDDGGPQWAPLRGAKAATLALWLSPNPSPDWQAAVAWPLAREAREGYSLLAVVGPDAESVGFTAAGLPLCWGNASVGSRWAHLAGVWTDGDGLRVYVDGVQVAACPHSAGREMILPAPEGVPSTTPWTALTIGGPSVNCTGEAEGVVCLTGTATYSGLIDEVTVHAAALAPAAVAELAREPEGASAVPAPVLRYGFDTAHESTLIQDSGPLRRPPAELVGDAELTAESALGSGALALHGAGGAALGPASALERLFGDSSAAEVTACMWLRPAPPGATSGEQVLLSVSDGNESSAFSVSFEWRGHAAAVLSANAFLSDGSTQVTCSGGGARIDPHRWHQVCWAFSGHARRGAFYVDGRAVTRCPPDGTGTFGGPSGAVSIIGSSGWPAWRHVVFGGVDGGGSSPLSGFHGDLDDLWVWAQELSPRQIARHFAAAAAGGRGGWSDGAEGAGNVLAWYRFDDSLGAALLRDDSPLHAHAVWQGTAAADAAPGPGVLGAALPPGISFDVPIDMLRASPTAALFAAWVRLEQDPTATGRQQAVVHWARDPWRPDAGAALALTVEDDGAVRFAAAAGAAAAESVHHSAAAGIWVHIAGAWSGGGYGVRSLTVYVNGAAAASASGTAVPASASELHTGTNTAPLRVGRAGWQVCSLSAADCIPLSAALDDVVIGAEPDAALVAALYARGSTAAWPPPPPPGTATLTAPTTAATVGEDVESLACDWPYAYAVAATPGLPRRAVYALGAAGVSESGYGLLDRRVRAAAVDDSGRATAPGGWELPRLGPGSSVAAAGNTVAVSEEAALVGLYTRDLGVGGPAVWWRRQRLRVPHVVPVLSQGQGALWGSSLNSTSPRDAVGSMQGPAPPGGWSGAAVRTGDGQSELGIDLGAPRRVVRITAGSHAASWLQGFSLSFSRRNVTPAELSAADWAPYAEHGVHRRFLLPVIPTEPYRWSFALDPPLVARHLRLVHFEGVNATARVALEVHADTAVPPAGGAPPMIALGGGGWLYAASRDRGDCAATGVWSSSGYRAAPHCTAAYAPLLSASGWCAPATDGLRWQWLQLDMGRPRAVLSAAVRPRQMGDPLSAPEAVTQYRLQAANSTAAGSWEELGTFDADSSEETWAAVVPVVWARYLRWIPVTYTGWPSMRVGAKVRCEDGEGGGAVTAFARDGDGWHPAARVGGPAVSLAAGPAAAAAIVAESSGALLLRLWRGSAAVAGDHPLPALPFGVQWEGVSVSDDGGAAVTWAPDRLLVWQLRHDELHLDQDRKMPSGCAGPAAITNSAGARPQETRQLFLSCSGGLVREFQVRRGGMTEVDALSTGGGAPARLAARYGALCVAAPGRLLTYAPAAARDLAVPLSVLASTTAPADSSGVIEAAAGVGNVTLSLGPAGGSVGGEDAALWVGDAMAERCDLSGGQCTLSAAALRSLGSSAPVYLATPTAVSAATAGTPSGVRVGFRIDAAPNAVAMPGSTPTSGDAGAGIVLAVDQLEGTRVLVSRPGEARVQIVAYDAATGQWQKSGALSRSPPPDSLQPSQAINSTSPAGTGCRRDGVLGTAADLGEVSLTGAAGLTLAAWIRLETPGSAPVAGRVVECANATAAISFVWNATADGTPGVALSYDVATVGGETWSVAALPDDYPSDGEWHHVAAVHRVHPARAELYVDGVEVARSYAAAPRLDQGANCYAGYGDGYSALAARFRDVYIWDSALSAEAVGAVRSGALSAAQAGALRGADGCHAAPRAGYGGALALMRRGIAAAGIPDDCSDPVGDRCGGVLVYNTNGSPGDGGAPDAYAPALRIRPPASGKRRFGCAVAALPDAASAGGLLAVGEDGSGLGTYGRVHLYSVDYFTPQGRPARTDPTVSEGGGLRATLRSTTELTNCTYAPPRVPLSLTASAGGVAVVCPSRGEGGAAGLRLFDVVSDGGAAPQLLLRWERLSPDGAGLGVNSTRLRTPAGDERAATRRQAPALRVDDAESFNGTAGPALITLKGPPQVTVVGRVQVDSFHPGAEGFSGVGGDVALFSAAETGSPVQRSAAMDGPWSGSGLPPQPDLGSAGYATQGGFCALRDRGRRIVCRMGVGSECHAHGLQWPTGEGAAFAVRFVADPSDSSGVGELTVWTSAKHAWLPAKRAVCAKQPRWGSPGGAVPLRLGAGLVGLAGPLYLWRTALPDSQIETLLEQLAGPAGYVPYPAAPLWTPAASAVYVYGTTDCSGPTVKVPLGHAEGRCTNCWDTCAKEFPDSSAVGAVRGMRVTGEARAAAAAYLLSNEGVTWQGCYADSDLKRDLPVYVGNESYTVATCALRCEPYAYFGLQDGQCWCGDGFQSDPALHAQLDDADCGGQCSGETSSASTLRCGALLRNAIYSLDAGCLGGAQDTALSTISSITWARPSDGCVSVASPGARHLRLYPARQRRPAPTGMFAASGAFAMNARVVVAADAAEGQAWVWRRSDGALLQALAPPDAVAEGHFGTMLQLHRDTLVATARYVPRHLASSDAGRLKPFSDTAAARAPYAEMADGSCSAGYRAIETADECGAAAAALSLPTWQTSTSVGQSVGAYGPEYPQGCYFKESTQRLHFNAHGNPRSTDTDRRALCARLPLSEEDTAALGGDFFASGAAYVYKMAPSGHFGLAQSLADAAAHNTTRAWNGAAPTARGVLASVSIGGRAALVHYPHDCGCSGRGQCGRAAPGAAPACQCDAGLDGSVGTNCGDCAPGSSWNGSSCAPAACTAGEAAPCSGHGQCSRGGACACRPGWAGEQCADPRSCEDLLEHSKVRFECP